MSGPGIARGAAAKVRPRLLAAWLGLACVRPALGEHFEGVQEALAVAEDSGAMRCAPRELAVARSHLEFAQLEREQGFESRAEQHLRIADEQARAAQLLSPPGRCGRGRDAAEGN